MGKLGYKGLLLLGGMMMLGGAAQAQYLRSSYFMEGTSARLHTIESGFAAYQRIF